MRVLLRTAFGLVVALAVPLRGAATSPAPAPGPGSLVAGLAWRLVGPFDGGPVDFLRGQDDVPGSYFLTTPTGGAWQTLDGGETWKNLNSPHSLDMTGAGIRVPWTDPSNPRRIAKKDESGIEISLDGGATWTSRHNLPIAEVDRIATVGDDPYWIAATTRSGQAVAVPSRDGITSAPPDVAAFARSGPHVDNRAATPASINGVTVNVVQADPVQPSLRFAGTNHGVSVSFDGGVSWAPLDLNLPNASVHDLAIHGHDLIAATYGWSVWVLDDITPLRQIAAMPPASAVVLFKPAAATPSGGGARIDFYLRDQPKGEVRLDILDAAGRVVHAESSAAPPGGDPWMPAVRPLAIVPGGHRVVWDLRMDAPPSPDHRYARLAPVLATDPIADPAGPLVLPGTYQVRLIVSGLAHLQTLVVKDDAGRPPSAADVAVRRRRFDLAVKICDDLRTAHAAFLQLKSLRAQLKPLLDSPDDMLAQIVSDLDTRLADLDGSDWNGLLLPDADAEFEYFVDKDIDEDPSERPVPVPLTKDYDDPTMAVGRAYENVGHAPAFAIASGALSSTLTRTEAGTAAPTAAELAGYASDHDTLTGILESWQAIKSQDVLLLNQELLKRKMRPVTIGSGATGVIVK
jgi:hypothetical protein